MPAVETRVRRQTGTAVTVWDNRERDLSLDDEDWYAICDVHSQLVSGTSQRQVTYYAAAPREWCSCCRGHTADDYTVAWYGCDICGHPATDPQSPHYKADLQDVTAGA